MRQAQPLLFTEYLKKLPTSFIFEHLLGDHSLKRRIVSPSLLEDIRESFSRQQDLRKHFEELGAESKLLCAQAYVSGRRGIAAPESKQLFNDLIHSFLVYSADDAKGNRFILGFEDLAPLLLPIITPVLLDGTVDSFSETTHPVWPYQCLNDCVLFISLSARSLIKLTQQGKLVRSSILALQRLLQGVSSVTAPDKSEKGRKTIMHLIMAYLRHESIVYEDGKLLVPDFTRISTWNAKPLRQRWEEFFAFALSELGGFRLEMLDCAMRQIGEQGFSLTHFGNERDVVEEAFRVLHFFGYIEAGKASHGNHPVWRKKQMEPFEEIEKQIEVDTIIIMPDFSAILPPQSSPLALFNFSLFGAYTSFDQVYKGTIDKTTLNDSLSRGVDPETILSYLDAWHAPDNVRVTVREWIREFSRLFISSRTLVVSNDRSTTMQLQSYEPLQKHIEPVTSDMVFSVKSGSERFVRDMLESMGFDARFAQAPVEGKKTGEWFAQEHHREHELTPVFDLDKEAESAARPVSVGKYSTELKALELNELFHVIDYAVLMGYQLRFEYEGSSYLPRGEYTVLPRNLHKGMDPAMDARQVGTEKEKRFDVRKIQRIGVQPV